MRYERAVSMHNAAREMVFVAEQGVMADKNRLDPTWQEMLNHATCKVRQSLCFLCVPFLSRAALAFESFSGPLPVWFLMLPQTIPSDLERHPGLPAGAQPSTSPGFPKEPLEGGTGQWGLWHLWCAGRGSAPGHLSWDSLPARWPLCFVGPANWSTSGEGSGRELLGAGESSVGWGGEMKEPCGGSIEERRCYKAAQGSAQPTALVDRVAGISLPCSAVSLGFA